MRQTECDLGYGARLLAPDIGFSPSASPPVQQIAAFLAAIPPGTTRHSAVAHWARDIAPGLDQDTQDALVTYLVSCENWATGIRQAIRKTAVVGDLASAPSRRKPANAYEAALRAAFSTTGLTLDEQVPVSKDGEHQRNGYYNSYWLDLCRRDPRHCLLLDIEMDGSTHRTDKGRAHDAECNASLRRRGWYVVRVPSMAHRAGALEGIARQTVAHLEAHHAALAVSMIGAHVVSEALRQAVATPTMTPLAPRSPLPQMSVLPTPRAPYHSLTLGLRRVFPLNRLLRAIGIVVLLAVIGSATRFTSFGVATPPANTPALIAPTVVRFAVTRTHNLRFAPRGDARTHTTLRRGWMLRANGAATPLWQPVCLVDAHIDRCGWAYRSNIVRR